MKAKSTKIRSRNGAPADKTVKGRKLISSKSRISPFKGKKY